MKHQLSAQQRAFNELQEAWYAKARDAGFIDAEDTSREDRPLRSWTGVNNLVDVPHAKTMPTFGAEEAFQHHSQYWDACIAVQMHGNRVLTANTIDAIWHYYCKGMPYRAIGKQCDTSKDTVWRVVQAMTAAMHLMGDSVEENVKIVLRAYDEKTDAGFIYATWRNALWFDDKRDDSRAPAFYKDASRYIKILLSAPTTEVRLACLQDDPDQIVGYAVLSTTNLEWVYVKIDYRKQGVGSMLTKGMQTVTKPRTKVGTAIAKEKGLKVIDE